MTEREMDQHSSTLYDKIGAAYLDAQKIFGNPRDDWAKDFVRTPGQLGCALTKCKILEIGCGNGSDIAFFDRRGHDVYGIDASRFMIEQAQKNVNRPDRLHCGKMEELDDLRQSHAGMFTQGKWGDLDYAFARYSLHYAQGDMDVVWCAVHSSLKNNGVFAFVVPNPLADIPFTDTGDYATAKSVTVKIFNEQIEIKYPFRKIDALFTPTFYELFRVRQMEYYPDEYHGASQIPAAIAVVAQKPHAGTSMFSKCNTDACIETQLVRAFKQRQRFLRVDTI